MLRMSKIEDVSANKVRWAAPASLQQHYISTAMVEWGGEQPYVGTVAGAVRFFASLPADQQEGTELFVASGVFSVLPEDTIIGAEVLRALARRPDLPEAR